MPESPDTSSPPLPATITHSIVASTTSGTAISGSCDNSGRPSPAMTSSLSSALPAHKTSTATTAASTSSSSSSSTSSAPPPGVATLNGVAALSPPHSRHGDSPSPPSSLGGATVNNGSVVNGGGGSMANGTGGVRTSSRDAAVGGAGGAPGSARQLSKVKRFLTTLQQFGSDISVEAGERVRNLILNLMNGTLTIDEFHHKLQETTNFPLRPFVIPFLKANLPLLQREIVHCARLTKQSPQQYLHQHEHLILDAAHSPHDPPDLFNSTHVTSDLNENGKRRHPDRHANENGSIDSSMDLGPPPKRHHPLMSPPLGHPTPSSSMGLHGSMPMRMEDYGMPRDYRERERALSLDREFRHYGFNTPRDLLDDRETEEEWKNIHTMLNCILGMVEKTKRALAILQHRSQTDRQELAMWVRRHAEGAENNLKKHAGDMMAQTLKTTEDRVSEVKRRAEEAVNEVKRQAVVELQKAVATAEVKARELVTSERGKMEKLIMDARRQAAEEAAIALNQQADSNEACWNCGRKASETCSGCNSARYCGSFCQHKDWENHHHSCGQNQTASVSSSKNSAAMASSKSSSSSAPTSATGSALISSSSSNNSVNSSISMASSGRRNPSFPLPSSSATSASSETSGVVSRLSSSSSSATTATTTPSQSLSSNQNSELKSHLESKR